METAQISDSEQLQIDNINLRFELTQRDQKIIYLQEQLDWFKRQIFGKKSERVASGLNATQLQFEGFETLDVQSKEQTQTVPAHERRKPNRNGQDAITLDPNLPVKTTILDVPEEEKICQETGIALVQIGVETTHKLAHEPGSYYIKEIIRPKYAHPEQPEAGILTASLPESILPKCRADDSLLAEIVTQKFADHLPLYRIANKFLMLGIEFTETMLHYHREHIHLGPKHIPITD